LILKGIQLVKELLLGLSRSQKSNGKEKEERKKLEERLNTYK
jgi:hypothetical protein